MEGQWQTLSNRQISKRLAALKTKYNESNTAEFQFREYTDNLTGEKIIRILPVKAKR